MKLWFGSWPPDKVFNHFHFSRKNKKYSICEAKIVSCCFKLSYKVSKTPRSTTARYVLQSNNGKSVGTGSVTSGTLQVQVEFIGWVQVQGWVHNNNNGHTRYVIRKPGTENLIVQQFVNVFYVLVIQIRHQKSLDLYYYLDSKRSERYFLASEKKVR